jgi:hypothetical protein
MQEKIIHVFDKTFKKVLTLSSTAVINMINGLFDTDYPPESTITYNWTEFEDDRLKKVLADTILTINSCHSYHMEAQIENDDNIVFRVFEYGFSHALRTRNDDKNNRVLKFPRPIIIYLDHTGPVPENYELTLDFGEQGEFCYRVPTLDFQSISIEELNEKKLIILIPFQLLKLRHIMKKKRTEENKQALIHLIRDDIIGSINKNLKAGNITREDAHKLYTYTQTLYHQVYSRYDELEEVSDMTDESYMTEVDIIYEEIHRLEAEISKKDTALAENATALAENAAALAEKDSTIAEKDARISELEKQLAALRS